MAIVVGQAIRAACEKAGLEFIEPDGVKRVPLIDTIRIFRGRHACEEFFQDMHWTLSEKGGDVIALFRSQKLLEDIYNITRDNVERVKRISEVATIQCILAETETGEGKLPPFKFKFVTKNDIGPVSYFVYGNKQTVVLSDGNDFTFLSYISSGFAEAHRAHFQSLWAGAVPMFSVKSANRSYSRR